MTDSDLATRPATERSAPPRPALFRGRGVRRAERPNYVGGVLATIWLVIVGIPIYMMVKYSFQTQQDYLAEPPLALPESPQLSNYAAVFQLGFHRFFFNTVFVMACVVVLVMLLAVPAGYAIVRSPSRFISGSFRMFLFGLAIPAQATVIPVFLMIQRLGLYDELFAIVLPNVAFALPLCILVLVGAMRDVPQETYEAMSLDGATPWRIFWSLVIPFSKSAVITIGVFSALQAWNSFVFPFVLTQSPEKRVLTLSLYAFQGDYVVNIPGLMAAVVMSAVPVFLLYLFGRRWLIAGLIGLGGK